MTAEPCLPDNWRWATRESDTAFARALIRQTMTPYWTRRCMVFNPSLFMRQWITLKAAIIECDGTEAGVIAWNEKRGIGYLREFHLLEAYRGRGLGGQVLHDWIMLQHKQGVSILRLKVFEDNPAKRLYERMGFRHTRTFKEVRGLLGMQYNSGCDVM